MEKIKSFNLETALQGLNLDFKIVKVPADATLDDAKYFVLEYINHGHPLENKKPMKFCLQKTNSLKVCNLSDLSDRSDELSVGIAKQISAYDLREDSGLATETINTLKKLEKQGYFITEIGDNPIILGETRPAPRDLGSLDTYPQLIDQTLDEDTLRDYYIRLIRYFCLLDLSQKAQSNKEAVNKKQIAGLIKELGVLLLNPDLTQEDESKKVEIKQKITELNQICSTTEPNSEGLLSKIKSFTQLSVSQAKLLIKASKSLKALANHPTFKPIIRDLNLWQFWYDNVFCVGIQNLKTWLPDQFNFFQGRHVATDKNHRLIINHLEPLKILPPYTSLVRIAFDYLKTYTKEELESGDFDLNTRQERFKALINEIKLFYAYDPVIETNLRDAINFAGIGVMCDLVIDCQNEGFDLTHRYFRDIKDGKENYQKGVLICIQALKNIMGIDPITF